MENKFKRVREELTEDTRRLINQWPKKDLKDFTEYLFKNRQKDRNPGGTLKLSPVGK